jgi:hypothetical protein
MKTILTIIIFAITINANSQKLVKEHYDWAKTKIKREYYTDAYGKLNGSYKAYSEYGGVMKQGQCKDDGPIGKWIENYDNGKLRYIKIYDKPGTYDFQVINGKIIAYYEDGISIKYERNFKNLELDGVVKEYDENGNITKEGFYTNRIFEPTGISKILHEKEIEKQKQQEAEKQLKRIEEFKIMTQEADKALELKDYNKAMRLYKSASELIENEKYPKDKLSEITELLKQNTAFFEEYFKNQSDSLNLDKIYFSNLIPVNRVGSYPGWNVMKYGKVTYTIYDMNNCQRGFNAEKPWESVFLVEPQIDRYDDISSDWIMNCITSNKASYTPIQILVAKTFIEYNKALQEAKNKIGETKIEYNYDIEQFIFGYDKEVFRNSIASYKKSYAIAKSVVELESKCFNKKNQIEALNKNNKKKYLYKKMQVVLDDFFIYAANNEDLELQFENITRVNLFLDMVITLYSKDTKELESKLKDAETIDQIKSLILAS